MAFRKQGHIHRPELRSHLSTKHLRQIFLDFLTTDGFLTAGSFLVFPWHFSPTSDFICNSRKKCVEVVRSFKMSFATLKYFHDDKQPKPMSYADKKYWEKCICTYDAQDGFLRERSREHWYIYFPAHLRTTVEQTGPLFFFLWQTLLIYSYSHILWPFSHELSPPAESKNACFMLSEVFCIIHKFLLSLKYNSSVLVYILNTILHGLCHRQFDL